MAEPSTWAQTMPRRLCGHPRFRYSCLHVVCTLFAHYWQGSAARHLAEGRVVHVEHLDPELVPLLLQAQARVVSAGRRGADNRYCRYGRYVDIVYLDIVDIVDMNSYLTPRCGSARLSSANLSMRSSRLAVFRGTWGGGGQCRHTRGRIFIMQSSPESVRMVCPGC